MVCGELGCLSGDTKVGINRAGRSFNISIKNLKHNFYGEKTNGHKWDSNIPTMIRSRCSTGHIKLFPLTSVLYSGKKETFTLTTSIGNSIRATLGHRFLTTDGWKKLQKLKTGDFIYVEKKQTSKNVAVTIIPVKIESIKRFGIEETYDIILDDEPHNFIANGIVTHNSGKTLALTYLVWSNYMKKQKNIFSNYKLFGIRYQEVTHIGQIDAMREGFFAGDELWLWLDSRTSKSQKNKVVADILLKSRKRDLTIAYTSQNVHQMDRRIRDVTDFVAYPMMSPDNSFCRLEIFRGCRPSFSNRVKPPLYFICEKIYSLYDTHEEIKPVDIEQIVTKLEKPKFNPISMNQAWLKYLWDKGIHDKDKMKQICEKIQADLLRPDLPMTKIPFK